MREGNRIRVHAQLIRASTDEHFWSASYDRELGDALTLEARSHNPFHRTKSGGYGHRRRTRQARHYPFCFAGSAVRAYLKGLQPVKGNNQGGGRQTDCLV